MGIRVSAACVIFSMLGSLSGTGLAQNAIQQPDETATISHDTVILRALDKITARITEIELPVGKEAAFGTLTLKARYCRTRPPIEPPETFAYLEIDDKTRGGHRDRVFEGWMVASSPALNALEHAVYDVWVINCRTSAPDTSDGNS